MTGYSSARKLTNVVGRVDYISNPERQEKIMSFHNTTDNDFWHKLARESQSQHKPQIHKKIVKKNGQEIVKEFQSKCCEAREFIIGLPQNCGWRAEDIADWFKETYNVECACAIHKKVVKDEKGNIIKDENGNTLYNLHAHLIFSERELLPEPLIVEHKTAQRTYYYDEKGKKCKKADAVKVVPKGTVIQEGSTRYFTDKNEYFKTIRFALEVKEFLLYQDLGLEKFDKRSMWATKHIGKNNPKDEVIREANKLAEEMTKYYKSIEDKYDFGNRTPKEEFCRLYNIPCKSTFSVVLTADIREKFVNFKELYPLTQKTAENRFESLTEPNKDKVSEVKENYFADWSDEQLEEELDYWQQQKYHGESDLEKAKKIPYQANSDNVVLQDVARINRKELTEKYKDQKGNTLIEKIERFIAFTKYCIRQLIDEIKVRNNVANANLNYDYEKSEPSKQENDIDLDEPEM